MSFTLRQLRYFLAVAEAGQLSAAARELYVSQSALTTAIQEIERVLEQPVFVRGSRGVTLTETGRAFLPKAREITRMVEEAALVTTPDAELVGRVRVGVTYTVMAYFLPQHIQRLSALFPNLESTGWRWDAPERRSSAGGRRPRLRADAHLEPAEPSAAGGDLRALQATALAGAHATPWPGRAGCA